MTRSGAYGMATMLKLPFETAVSRTREELEKEGFGVLTEIDVKATLKKNSSFRAT